MAKLVYTRRDIEVLADRLEHRASSVMLSDMPRLCSDMRAGSALLRFMLENGMPVTTVEIEINNGTGK
jgi:hypothetical protein